MLAVNREKVPKGWWLEACVRVHAPLACVGRGGQFIWLNQAFCELVGYSQAELIEKSWKDITVVEDIGGDQLAVESLLKGEQDEYFLTKQYRHKQGHFVPIGLYVFRFPPDTNQDLECYIAAVIDLTKDTQIQAVEREMEIIKESMAIIRERYIDCGPDKVLWDALRAICGKYKGLLGWLSGLVAAAVSAAVTWWLSKGE